MNYFSQYKQGWRLFNRDIKLFIIGTFFATMGSNIIWLIFNLYLKELDWVESAIGKSVALKSLGSAIATLPIAFILGKGRIKRWLLSSAFFNIIAYVLVSISKNENIINGSVFSIGALSAIYVVASAPFIMSRTSPAERPFAYSMNAAMSTLSGIIGSLLSGALRDLMAMVTGNEVVAYQATLLCGALFALASLLPYSLIKESEPKPDISESNPSQEPGKKEKFSLTIKDVAFMIKILLPSLFFGFGAGITIPFVNLYFKTVWKMNDGFIGLVFAAGQASTFTGMILAPFIFHKLGRIRTIVGVQWASIPFILILAFIGNLPLAILAYLVRQALMNMSSPVQDQFTMEITKPVLRPIINALEFLVWTLAWTISSKIGGNILEKGSFTPCFLITASAYAIGTGIFLVFFHSCDRVSEKTTKAELCT